MPKTVETRAKAETLTPRAWTGVTSSIEARSPGMALAAREHGDELHGQSHRHPRHREAAGEHHQAQQDGVGDLRDAAGGADAEDAVGHPASPEGADDAGHAQEHAGDAGRLLLGEAGVPLVVHGEPVAHPRHGEEHRRHAHEHEPHRPDPEDHLEVGAKAGPHAESQHAHRHPLGLW